MMDENDVRRWWHLINKEADLRSWALVHWEGELALKGPFRELY